MKCTRNSWPIAAYLFIDVAFYGLWRVETRIMFSLSSLSPLFFSCLSKVLWWRVSGSFLIVLMRSSPRLVSRTTLTAPDGGSPLVIKEVERVFENILKIVLSIEIFANCLLFLVFLREKKMKQIVRAERLQLSLMLRAVRVNWDPRLRSCFILSLFTCATISTSPRWQRRTFRLHGGTEQHERPRR